MKNGFHTSTAKPRVVKEKERTHVERDADDLRIPLLEDQDIEAHQHYVNTDFYFGCD